MPCVPAPMNVAGYVFRFAQGLAGDRAAITTAMGSVTYREFAGRVLRFAGALRGRGVRPGDRVTLYLRSSQEFFEAFFATLSLGAGVVPVNSALHPAEIAYIVGDSSSAIVVQDGYFGSTLRGELRDIGIDVPVVVTGGLSDKEYDYESWMSAATPIDRYVDVTDDQVAWLFYTSGTTGRPKGVTWTHTTLQTMILSLLADVFPALAPTDVFLHVAPLTHGSGMLGMAPWARGARSVIAPPGSFHGAETLDLIERERITHISFMAPLQLTRLTEAARDGRYDLSRLRTIAYGGAPISGADLRRAVEVFGDRLAQLYAQGECLTTTTCLSGADHLRGLTEPDLLVSSGRVRTGVDVRIVDQAGAVLGPGGVGEVAVRGQIVMRGYWNQLEATATTVRDGWLHTGDVGRMDDDGFLYLLDRSNDVIVSGGMNIYPREVEEVIAAIDGVAEVCVVGIPDDKWGEGVHAIVVADESRVTEADIERACLAKLARFKRPRSTEFRAALPSNAYGKVLRRELREEFWAGLDRRIGGGRSSHEMDT
jgi:acyl-CoA synthetase (AMP-forming)/AMP-acid ligase II